MTSNGFIVFYWPDHFLLFAYQKAAAEAESAAAEAEAAKSKKSV